MKRFTLNDNDRKEWVQNDESLYLWWKETRMSLGKFVKENRTELDKFIRSSLGRE